MPRQFSRRRSGQMTDPNVAGTSLFRGEVTRYPGFYEFRWCALVPQNVTLRTLSKNLLSAVCTYDSILSVIN